MTPYFLIRSFRKWSSVARVIFAVVFIIFMTGFAFGADLFFDNEPNDPQHTQQRRREKSSCSGCNTKMGEFDTPSKEGVDNQSDTGGADVFFDYDEQSDSSDEEDEFLDFDESESFSDDEFEEFDDSQVAGTMIRRGGGRRVISPGLQWVLGILAFTVLSGFLVRNAKTRKLRIFFLLASVVILGFYRGACPCPIMSLQNLILAIGGLQVGWQSLVWFLALIPITYIFGKVWCGWICHLGALQEFLFMGKFEILKSHKTQDILRYIRIVVLVLLVAQILITKTNIFVRYDPFKVAYNLFSAYILGYILLGILLVSSLFINRPFCRAVCPIGLILGWVSLIPGASVIGVQKGACKSCNQCAGACKINAITRENRISRLVNQDCIACGECLDACGQKGLGFQRAGKEFPNTIKLEKE